MSNILEVSSLTKTYSSGIKSLTVLSDISFSIQSGDKLSIVGSSGSGKTTLVNLLPRFYELTSGSISIDGHPINELTLNSLREQIAIVSQSVTLFNCSIRENIAYGSLADASDEAVIEAAKAAGLEMRAQVGPRPVGLLLGLELTLNPFSGHPVYQTIANEPFDARWAALRDPAFRERLLNDEPDAENPFVKSILRSFGKMFVLGDPPDYEPTEDKTVAAIANARGTTPEVVALDLMLADEGRGMLYLPFLNYAQGSLDPVKTMLESPASLPGLSDGGAHVGMICDGSFPTTLLTHWGRDRSRGDTLPLEFLIKRQSRDTAAWVGLKDRGVLAPGYRADLNVIDFDRLTLHAPYIVHDLPAGGRRLMQKADGYEATLVAGEIIQRGGEATGAKPGRLVRGAQAL